MTWKISQKKLYGNHSREMKRWAHKRRDMKDKMRKHNMYLIGVHEGRDREGQRQRCEDDDWEISRHDKRHSRIPPP